MALSSELISQFVKATKDTEKKPTETMVYGTIVMDGRTYVRLDGAPEGVLTPVDTTTKVKNDDRVTVMIKDHTAIVTGNMTTPSATTDDIGKVTRRVTQYDDVTAYNVTSENVRATNAMIDNLLAITGKYENLEAVNAVIETLKAQIIEGKSLTVEDVKANAATIDSIKSMIIDSTEISTDDLDAINAEITNLKSYTGDFTYFSAVDASIKDLSVDKLSAKDAAINYANIDFSNIGKAAVKELFADSGMIKDLVIKAGHVTGELVGVTIVGDLIKGNTIMADKLVIKGEDGLYYKLNHDAGALEFDSEHVDTKFYLVERVDEPVYYEAVYVDSVGYKSTGDSFNPSEANFAEVYEDEEWYGYLVNEAGEKLDVWVYKAIDNNGRDLYFTVDFVTEYRRLEEIEEPGDAYDPIGAKTTDGLDVYWVDDLGGPYICIQRTAPEWADNQLHGSVIVAKSVTAEQIKVADLVAFEATIGGFKIGDNAIYSGVKETVDNSTRGIYLDRDGQLSIGDEDNYLKYHIVTKWDYILDGSGNRIDLAGQIDHAKSTKIDGAVSKEGHDIYFGLIGNEESVYYEYSVDGDNERFVKMEKIESAKLEISADSITFGDDLKTSGEDLRRLTEHVTIGTWTDFDFKQDADGQIHMLSEDDISTITDKTKIADTFKYNSIVYEGVYHGTRSDGSEVYYTKFDWNGDGLIVHLYELVADTSPSISLAEGDTNFKQLITNKKTMFMDGEVPNTVVDTDGVSTDNLSVDKEIRHNSTKGSYTWAFRSNGNYGLSWQKGGIS